MGREAVLESGGLFDGRIAWSRAGPTSERAPRRPTAGFWRDGGRVEGNQKLRKRLTHAGGRESTTGRTRGALPGEMPVLDGRAGQTELGVRRQDQPGPAVGLLG